jgi:diguanylate cyclase (GGDEF)-like protein/PAS domain S-box-containing protein
MFYKFDYSRLSIEEDTKIIDSLRIMNDNDLKYIVVLNNNNVVGVVPKKYALDFLLNNVEQKDATNCRVSEIIEKDIDFVYSDNITNVDAKKYIIQVDDNKQFIKTVYINKNDTVSSNKYEKKLKLWASIFNTTNEAVVITDEDNNILDMNLASEVITGYSKEEVIGKNPRIFASNSNENSIYVNINKSIDEKSSWQGNFYNKRKNDEIYPVSLNIHRIDDYENKVHNYFLIFSDLSYSNKKQDSLFHLAYHDSLTNLPNRLKLKAQLEVMLNNARRNNLKFAVLFLDLDNFKIINDTLGHSSGDEILISFANKFKSMIRTNDMIARLGGDEFVFVLNDISNYLFIERICNKILGIVSKSIQIDNKNFKLGVSIGVSVYPDNGNDIDSLINKADTAMYHAKSDGKNIFKFYSNSMTIGMEEHKQVEDELIAAIKNDHFELHYQPEIDLKTNDVFTLEVLSRLKGKDSKLVYPGKFLSHLESTQHIFDFEKLILEKACFQLKAWHEKEIYKGKLSINISGKHLENGDLYQTVNDVLIKTNINPEFLELEFSEADVMKISTKTLFTLNSLSTLGISLSIDDFGTSFTSFNYLKECSINKLKIDKSHIDLLLKDEADEGVLKSIIDVGVNLGISVTAEGIEFSEQDEIVRKNDCTKVMGYYYAKPMDEVQFEQWYKNFKLLSQGIHE